MNHTNGNTPIPHELLRAVEKGARLLLEAFPEPPPTTAQGPVDAPVTAVFYVPATTSPGATIAEGESIAIVSNGADELVLVIGKERVCVKTDTLFRALGANRQAHPFSQRPLIGAPFGCP